MLRKRGRSPSAPLQYRYTNAVNNEECSSEDYDDDDEIILDTDDQEDVIHSLQEQSYRQSKQFQTLFFGVGVFAMIISLVYPFLCHDECSSRLFSCWSHTLVSCGSHVLSIKLSRSLQYLEDENGELRPLADPMLPPHSVLASPTFLAAAGANLVPLVLWISGAFDQDIDHFHIGLVMGNMVTLVGSIIVLWDWYSTRQALAELNGAKYEHKSL